MTYRIRTFVKNMGDVTAYKILEVLVYKEQLNGDH